jgi:hypothetical protein
LIPSQDASHGGHNFFEPIQFLTPFADGYPIFRGLQSPQRAGESVEFHCVKKGVIYGLHPILDGHHPACLVRPDRLLDAKPGEMGHHRRRFGLLDIEQVVAVRGAFSLNQHDVSLHA